MCSSEPPMANADLSRCGKHRHPDLTDACKRGKVILNTPVVVPPRSFVPFGKNVAVATGLCILLESSAPEIKKIAISSKAQPMGAGLFSITKVASGRTNQSTAAQDSKSRGVKDEPIRRKELCKPPTTASLRRLGPLVRRLGPVRSPVGSEICISGRCKIRCDASECGDQLGARGSHCRSVPRPTGTGGTRSNPTIERYPVLGMTGSVLTLHLNDEAARFCPRPVDSLAEPAITTVEAVGPTVADWKGATGPPKLKGRLMRILPVRSAVVLLAQPEELT